MDNLTSLRDRIARVITDGGITGDGHGTIADAVIAVVSDEYINSRGMFHEPDRCLGCEECNEYDPYEAKADAERQQWADDEGLPND